MRIFILTLFPAAVDPYLHAGILGIARRKRLLDLHLVNFRQFGRGRHRAVDDRPFGGGPGMVLRPEPVFDCVESIERRFGPQHRILLTPAGKPFGQERARELARKEGLLLLCGRYEGFDERIRDGLEWEEISIGDFVLCGGELAALCVVEATARLIPGVLGDESSNIEESFSAGTGTATTLEYPQYTRPREYRGMNVPDVLISGDHESIRRWRRDRAKETTLTKRPDLIEYPGSSPIETSPDRRDEGSKDERHG